MIKQRSSDLKIPSQGQSQMGEGLQVDYSYNQWRHAQMQQLEQSYEVQCDRDSQF